MLHSSPDGQVSDTGHQHLAYFKEQAKKPIARAILEGTTKALDEKPELDIPEATVYVEIFEAQFNSLLAENHERSTLRLHTLGNKVQNAKVALATCFKRKYELENMLKTWQAADTTPRNSNLIRLALFLILSGTIMIGEWILLGEAFQMLGKNKIFSMLIAAGFASSLTIILHYGERLVSGITNRTLQKLATYSGILLVVGSMVAAAILRSSFLKAAHANTISPLWFFLFNLFFTAAFFLSIKYGLQPSLKALLERKRQKSFVGQDPNTELKKLTQDIAVITEERDTAQTLVEEADVIARTTEHTIWNAYMECIAEYKLSNITKRNAIPESFWNMTAPSLRFYFINNHQYVTIN